MSRGRPSDDGPPRLFTLDEARQLLPVLRPLVAEMRGRAQELERHQQAHALLARRGSGEGPEARAALTRHRSAMEGLVEELRRLIGHITHHGVEVKGLDQGLLDFRSERDGRTIYLCWQYDEPDITWWHNLESGFSGRQPLV